MRAMKNSGIEWIGEIPLGWEIRRIKSIGTYRNGLTYSPNDLVGEGEGTLVFRSSNIQNGALSLSDNVYVSCKIPEFLKVKQGDILICSRNGSKELIGKNAIIDIDGDYSFGAFMMIFRCANPRYIYYILNSSLFTYYLNSFLTSTVNQLTAENFGNMKFAYCPDIDGQNRIVSFLDAKCAEIDALIAAKEKTNALLKERRQSIIYEAVTKGLDPAVPMKDSGVEWIGEIPEGWSVWRMKHLAVEPLLYGANATGVEFDSDLPRYVRITDITSDRKLNSEGKQSLPETIACDYMLDTGDILFARSGATSGKSFYYDGHYGRCCFAGYLIRFRPDSKKVISKFLYYYTLTQAYESWTQQIFIQATIQNISAEKYSNLFFAIPPTLDEQAEIVSYLDSECGKLDEIIFDNESTIQKLKEYRQSLIYEAVTGKVEVKNENQSVQNPVRPS